MVLAVSLQNINVQLCIIFNILYKLTRGSNYLAVHFYPEEIKRIVKQKIDFYNSFGYREQGKQMVAFSNGAN